MQIPPSIIQGDTVTWRDASTADNLGNVIDSTWTLTWTILGPNKVTLVSTAYANGWETSISAAQSSSMTATTSRDPNYAWQAVAAKSGKVITVGSGQLLVKPSFSAAAAGFETRTPAELDLASVQAAIRARVSGGAINEYWIGNRRLRNEPVAELLKLEARFKLIVSRERRARLMANGLGDPKNTFVRFT